MKTTEQIVKEGISKTNHRIDFWTYFLQESKIKNMVELGVYRGDFASRLLKGCSSIEKYYMIDPWRHLDNWNKPANKTNDTFTEFFSETKSKTDFAAEKRIILRGKTTEVIEEIPDGELDFGYVDGDHTLKGISTDLIRLFPKIKEGGWIGGDDFSHTVWQHSTKYEPTMVFPFAVYFAEAVDARIYALPNSQFLIEKKTEESFCFIDLVGCYNELGLKEQLKPTKLIKRIKEIFSLTK